MGYEGGRFPTVLHCTVLGEVGYWPLTAVEFYGAVPHVKIPIPAPGRPLRRLILLLLCGAGSGGMVDYSVRLEDPEGQLLGEHTQFTYRVVPEELVVTIILRDPTLNSPATIRLILLVDGEPHYETKLEVYDGGTEDFA